MTYACHILILINIYIILALSLNVTVGYVGLMSLCHAAFYAVGAYTSSLLAVQLGWSFLPTVVVAIIFAAALSLVVSVPSLRLKSDYFVLSTLSFQMIVFALLYNNLFGITGGPFGLSGIPVPSILGWEANTPQRQLLLSSVLAMGSTALLWAVLESPFGRTLRAIRDDETAAASLGKNVPAFKIIAFAIGAGVAAVAGALYAGYVHYIDPSSFALSESIFILSVVVIGGAGSFLGPIVGAATLVMLPEALRFLNVPEVVAADIRQITYGVLLIVLMRRRPQGLFGKYEFN